MHLFAMSDVSQNADKNKFKKKNISDIIICLGQTVPFIFSSASNLGSGWKILVFFQIWTTVCNNKHTFHFKTNL